MDQTISILKTNDKDSVFPKPMEDMEGVIPTYEYKAKPITRMLKRRRQDLYVLMQDLREVL